MVYNLLRHTKGMLFLAAMAVILLIRPSSMDPGGNLGAFMDASSSATFDLGTLMGGATAPTTSSSGFSSPSFMTPGHTISTKSWEEEKDSYKEAVRKSRAGSSTSTNRALSNYDPDLHPLVPLPKEEGSQSSLLAAKDIIPAVDVHMIVDVSSDSASVGPQSKFLLDGLERSPYTNVVGMTFLNPTMHQVQIGQRRSSSLVPMVWMVDWGSMQRDCHRLERVLEKLQRKEKEYVLLVDYTGSTRQSKCDSLFLGDPYVRLAKRTIVTNRHYDHATRQIVPGSISENTAMSTTHTSSNTEQQEPVMQASLVVRERFVTALRNSTRSRNPMKSTRRTDLCFFWKPGDYSHYGFWRRDVSNFVKRVGKSSKYTTLVDVIANDEEGMVLGNIQLKYIKALLHCKLVVIAQRDEWEDHYRLYESLASGALVLMDSMLAPPEGLRNKTNVLIYDSLESLERLIHYGLERDSRRQSIAKRGMQLALGRYRSWHRVEQLLFGQPLFQVDQPLVDAPPKMTRPQISLVDGDVAVST